MHYTRLQSRLTELPNVWSSDIKYLNIESFNSLQSFLSNTSFLSLNKQKNGKKPSDQIPYQQSVFHFFLYYAYYPKIPFAIKENNQLLFGSFYGKNHQSIELSFPFIPDGLQAINYLEHLFYHTEFGSLLKKENIKQILLRDCSEELVKVMTRYTEDFSFKLNSLREIYYQTYDLDQTLGKTGKNFSNLRWHLNKFHRAGHKMEVVDLADYVKPVIHLIGSWKKNAVKKRRFSYVNLRSDKLAARLFSQVSTVLQDCKYSSNSVSVSDCVSRVLKVDGRIASFNFGYPLGLLQKENVFAHAVGITDLSIPHLAEYAQYDFWKQIQKKGYSFVNDGPSWRNSLEVYKQKFRPIEKNRYYYVTLNI